MHPLPAVAFIIFRRKNMKKTYSAPVMYREAYIAEQYIAASDCGTSIGTPNHGHFTNSAGETHCAFTSSNCGENASGCQTTTGGTCNSFTQSKHQVITRENGTVITRPSSSYHNCHVLSDNDAAVAFATTYTDEKCGAGVAALMGLGGFDEIVTAFS